MACPAPGDMKNRTRSMLAAATWRAARSCVSRAVVAEIGHDGGNGDVIGSKLRRYDHQPAPSEHHRR